MTRIGANDSHNTVPLDDLAVAAHFFDRSRNSHSLLLDIPKNIQQPTTHFERNTIRARVMS
jgi:hypothetical protein